MDDLGSKLKRALDETVGATAKRRQADEALQNELNRKRTDALRGLKKKWRSDRESCARVMQRCVNEYEHAVTGVLKESLTHDSRMPIMINYLERYSAMKAMQDRSQLLTRIEQTIDLAERALNRVEELDIQAAVEESAARYRTELLKLSQIKVGPANDVEDEECELPTAGEPKENLLDSLEADADTVFADDPSLDIALEPSGLSEDERKAAFDKALLEACKRADEAHEKRLRSNALAVVGSSADLEDLEEFCGSIDYSLAFEADELKTLSGLVRKSFETYSMVVRDNGLFSAFSEGSSFGRCAGYLNWMSAWDDWSVEGYGYEGSEYGGDSVCREYVRSRIPTTVEYDDDNSDSVQTVIERMRDFNSRHYFGMLDDDFKQHVDAFWFGYGKLMEFINGMVDIDLRQYLKYRSRVSCNIAARCGELALMMDDAQLGAFRSEVHALRNSISNVIRQ